MFLTSTLTGSHENDGPEHADVLDLLVRQVSHLLAHHDHHLHDTVQHSCRREGQGTELQSADPVPVFPAVLRDCDDSFLLHGQHLLQQRSGDFCYLKSLFKVQGQTYSIDTAKVRYSLSPRDAGNSRERIKIHVKSTQNSCEIRASFSQLPCIGKIRAGNFHT